MHESRSLKKGETLIPAFVFATGYNSKYIYSKQHPLLENSKEKINISITNYYIIERTKSIFQDKPIFGPFNKTEFEKNAKSSPSKTRIQLNFFNRILIKIQANKNLPFFDVNNLLSLVIPPTPLRETKNENYSPEKLRALVS